MLRVLLWKLGTEWAHLLRALSPQPQHRLYYFAFGANLCREVMQRRGIKVLNEFDYVLENAGLRFSQPGFYKGHGYASADAIDGEVVYGKIYEILARDAVRMDYFEGVPFLKAHDKIERQGSDFRFYYYRTTRIVDGLKPTREYLDYLLVAYRQMPAVPAEYLAAMRAQAVLEDLAPQDQTGLLVDNVERWPRALRPLLINYERACLKAIEFLWHRSLLQRLIKL